LTFHPTMKRRLHERLQPLIGEEEADALLDEISPLDPITREWFQDRFDRIEDRFATKDWIEDRFVTKEHLDLRLEGLEGRLQREIGRLDGKIGMLDGKIGHLDAEISERFRQQTLVLIPVAALIGTVSGIVQAIVGG